MPDGDDDDDDDDDGVFSNEIPVWDNSIGCHGRTCVQTGTTINRTVYLKSFN